MTTSHHIIDEAPLQDQDLLLRMNQYFDALDQRLRHGQGWFIFNASGPRLSRIAQFISVRLEEDHNGIDSYLTPWRDFALNAFVAEVGLREIAPNGDGSFATEQQRREFELARQVNDAARERLMQSEMLVLIGMRPRSWHEAVFLDQTIDERYRKKLATILLTNAMPEKLEAEFNGVDPSQTLWSRLFARMYETSLVAL
ncbi:MAG TPA: hypothetical protein PK691_07045 [Thermomicrobiales bacterium]|nr:hypothetical protein [Thermomicrobiales bacterium]